MFVRQRKNQSGSVSVQVITDECGQCEVCDGLGGIITLETDELGDCVSTRCPDPDADNYDAAADPENPLTFCQYWGCMDPTASNFNPSANMDPLDECLY